jgi:hypothetical protein
MVAISDSAQATIAALREIADRHGRSARVTEESAPWEDPDPYGPPDNEAVVVVDGSPQIEVRLLPHGEDGIDIDDLVVFDVDREHVPAFVDAVLRDNVSIKGVTFPPSATLRVHLPGDVTYSQGLTGYNLMRGEGWLGRIRSE